MTDPTMLDDALRHMSDRDLRIGARALVDKANSDSTPAWAGLWHALAVAMAEETDRRRDILHALDPDLEDPGIGEIVA